MFKYLFDNKTNI